MHNAAYAAMGLDLVYLAARVPPVDLERALEGLWALGARGVNLTVPHKQAALPLCVRVTPAAQFMGAVNALRRGSEGWEGENTDAGGWLDSWQAEIGQPLSGRKAIVLGAGGASRAIQFALRDCRLVVLNRTPDRGHGPLEQLAQELEKDCLVVNTTTVGMSPDTGRVPVELPSVLPEGCVVCDVIYAPRPTRFLREAASTGSAGRPSAPC